MTRFILTPTCFLLAATAAFGQAKADVAPIGSTAALRQKLLSKDEATREQAFERIKDLGDLAAPLTSDLIKLFDWYDALEASYAVAAIGKSAVPALSLSLTGRTTDQRAMSAMALGKIGAAAEPALPTLMALTRRDPTWYVRSNAAEALGLIGRLPKQVLPILRAALDDGSPWVVISAHEALGRFTPDGVKIRVAWQRRSLANKAAPDARCLAAALASMTGWSKDKQVREGLIDALRGKVHTRVRRQVIDALKKGGTGSEWALPFMIDALGDTDSTVRSHVAEALGIVTPGSLLADDVVIALTKALDDRSSSVRQMTTYALRKLASPKHPATEVKLRKLITTDRSKYVRNGAKDALKAFERTH